MNSKQVETKVKKDSQPRENDFVFKVPEFEFYDRGLLWYGLAFLGFALLIILAMEFHFLLLGVVLMFSAVIFYQLALVEPNKTNLVLKKSGISFRDKFYPWESFHSFSLSGSEKHLTVHLEKLSTWGNPVVIPLPKTTGQIDKNSPLLDSDLALTILRSYLPERLRGSLSINDWLSRVFKF
jgi:hypothetical protein